MRCEPYSAPLAWLTLALRMAVRTSASVRPKAASFSGAAWMRSAGLRRPLRSTTATPSICEIWRAISVSARSDSSIGVSSSDCMRSSRIGPSLGLTFFQVGRLGSSAGSRAVAALMAACTSCAATSMLLSSVNCSVMLVLPSELLEVMSVMPGTPDSSTSSGVATDEAMVSGLAPGSLALIWIVGRSISGTAATGSCGNASTPRNSVPSVSSTVAIG